MTDNYTVISRADKRADIIKDLREAGCPEEHVETIVDLAMDGCEKGLECMMDIVGTGADETIRFHAAAIAAALAIEKLSFALDKFDDDEVLGIICGDDKTPDTLA